MNKCNRTGEGGPRSWFHDVSRLLFATLLSTFLMGCQQGMPSRGTHPSHSPSLAGDQRIPLPLLPHMAEHQKANMREHLAAIQEILAALSTNDFAGVERTAARIGYSEQMGRMCAHMGTGAAGFTEMALHFHRTADTIGVAAKQRNADASLKAVAATLQTCVGCHATYRQQIVDEATWNRIAVGTGKNHPPSAR